MVRLGAWWITACLVLLISACGGGGGGSSSTSTPTPPSPAVIDGNAAKGPVSGGTVTAYAVTSSGAKGSALGSTTTDANGNYSLTLNYTGQVLLEITGGTYTDEATGQSITVPTAGLQAVVANVKAGSTLTAQITPLTSMAAARAEALTGGLTATNINAANQQVGSYFGSGCTGGVLDILNTQPINSLVANSATGATQCAINYGLILAGISQEAQTLSLTHPFDLVTALTQDFSDAVFNGEVGTTPIQLEGAAMNTATGTTDLATAISTFSANNSLNVSGGTVSSTLITSIETPPTSYTVGGTVSGLTGSVGLGNSNGDRLSLSSNGVFTFATAFAIDGTYDVTVTTQPTGQTCSVVHGSGTVGSANVTNIVVSCSTNTYTIGVTVSGLTGTGLVLQNNGGDNLDVSSNGSVNFSTPLATGSPYDVTVLTQPTGQTCSVTSGSGTVGTANVSVTVSCAATTYTIGVIVSGLTGTGLVLQNNGGDNLDVSGNGSVNFSTPLASGATYDVTILTQPSGQTCSIPSGSGTVGTANINVAVSCVAPGTETVLYSFAGCVSSSCGPGSDGVNPEAGLILGNDGNFYGTTTNGGTNGDGTVFKITPSGVETVLYSFAGCGPNNTGTCGPNSDGAAPEGARLILGNDGNFYGTTSQGGSSNVCNNTFGIAIAGCGTVFKITPAGTETVLYSFAGCASSSCGPGSDGASPFAGLILGSDGNFYGTSTSGGTTGDGTVFKIAPSGTETVLYSFAGCGSNDTGTCGSGSDGASPFAGLILGSDGNFYGTTLAGGAIDAGTVFKITSSGSETVLYSFAGCGPNGSTGTCPGSDGANPEADLIVGSDGNFYSTTEQGGANGYGTVFKITAAGTETVLYSFFGCGSSAGATCGPGVDGANPSAGLILGNDGNFYGTTLLGGANDDGTVFQITSSGTETPLLSFSGCGSSGTTCGPNSDGTKPEADLIQGTDGNLYGTTYQGGANGDGTVFKLTP